MDTHSLASYLSSLSTGYRVLYREMSIGGEWHVYRGSAGLVILRSDSEFEGDPLPILVRNVHAMTERALLARVQTELSR